MPESNKDMPHMSDAMGCVFCKTGSEEATVALLKSMAHVHCAFVPKKAEHRSQKGVKSTVEKVLFPGYVFFHADDCWTPSVTLWHADYVLRLLTKNGQWQLAGEDEVFARWLLSHGGLLEMSKAYQEGTRVVIRSGPLKELEGIITKVDRHNRNGQVTVDLFGRKTSVWLAFEIIREKEEAVPEKTGAGSGEGNPVKTNIP